jgi:transcriptional regulator with XRE-family HTH domain
MKFGPLLYRLRMAKRMTLREFCRLSGADPSNVSKIERGRMPPPGHDRIDEFAWALDLEKKSQGWQELHDAADMDRGMVPKDLLTDEELVEVLPIFYRGMREGDTEELIEALRRA